MKLLTRLEKNKVFWFLLASSLIFFFLRLPSLIEPHWYGDEGIYQVIGKSLNNGRLLYSQIWDNKPPLLYLTYALFNGEQFSVRLFSLIIGIVTILMFYKLTSVLFKNLKASIASTLVFTLLFATPIIEGNIANAENFMLLPIIAAAILVYKYADNKTQRSSKNNFLAMLSAGLLLGIAFLFKAVAVFDFVALFLFLHITVSQKRFSLKHLRRSVFTYYRNNSHFLNPFALGFLLPLTLTALYFFVNRTFLDFTTAVFSNNLGYVGYANQLIIPQGFLILKLLLVSAATTIIYLKRRLFSKVELFILLWFVFSLFNTYFSGRAYTHYALLLLPSWCLLLGLLLTKTGKQLKVLFLLLMVISALLVTRTFNPNITKAFSYYGNALSFLLGGKDIHSYRAFFDKKTPRDYAIASFIKTHTTQDDKVLVWGDSAQIYALSDKHPIGRYTVSYHITRTESALTETRSVLREAKPKYVIILKEAQTFPFSLPSYTPKYVFDESVVYERSL
jgi:4-amino-4-deoxy-L-arabinose transferase-like glycosyltransferase